VKESWELRRTFVAEGTSTGPSVFETKATKRTYRKGTHRMRRHWTVALSLAATLLAGLLAAPAAPAAEAFSIERKDYVVKTRHGKMFIEIAHPTRGGKIVKSPTILTISPYTTLFIGRNGGTITGGAKNETWVKAGYSRGVADVVGTGNSGGCYDYGGKREKETGHDLVEWIAKQKWSTGKIGMIGGSYEGTTATATATQAPTGLKTIVPEAAISRWYGYAYSGGMRYFLNNEDPSDEGFDTPLLFDFGLALPPPVDPAGEDWAGRVAENITPCDQLQHMERGYDNDTPDYDKFWIQRDYLRDADKIDIPVLVAHNWGDWNVKQEEGWNLFHALKNSPKKVMFFGDRYSGHGTPDGAYAKTVRAWMDHYLMGENNGTPSLPKIISETANYDGALEYLTAPSDFKTRNYELTAQETAKTSPDDYQWKLLPQKPFTGPFSTVSEFNALGINAESHANHHYTNNHDWFWFETPALKKDTRIFGEIKIKVRVSSPGRKWITMTPGIVDVDPACHQFVAGQHNQKPECLPRSVQSVTRGFLDSRYRNGLAKAQEVDAGAQIDMTVEAKPIDYVFKKGHVIGLNLQTEIVDWALPKPYPCDNADTGCAKVRIHWEDGATKLILPIVNGPTNTLDLFDFGAHGDH